MSTKIIITDDITGKVIDPQDRHTIELRVTAGTYAGASAQLDLSSETFKAKIIELLDSGSLDEIFGGPEVLSKLPTSKPHRARQNYKYINTDRTPEFVQTEAVAQLLDFGRRNSVEIDESLKKRVNRGVRVLVRTNFRLSNVSKIKEKLDALGLDMVIDRTFRSLTVNSQAECFFGDVYAVLKS